MKTLIKITLALFIALAVIKPAAAQQSKAEKQAAKEAYIKEMIDSKHFTFQARNVYPAHGGLRYLNSDYDVRIAGDSVIAYLPYFGVAYSGAGYNGSGDNGIKFTSTDFDYKNEQAKNGSWNITIIPKNEKTASRLIFNIQTNGRTDLTVLSPNRQNIRFDGEIKEASKAKK